MNEQTRGSHSITGAFVFLLLGLFAVMSSALVLGGVKAYSTSARRAEENNNFRVLSAYVRSRLRALDEEDAVSVETVDGAKILTITEDYDGDIYLTRLYSDGKSLREWFSEAGRDFRPGDGDEITPAVLFEPALDEKGVLTVRMQESPEADETQVSVLVRCAAKKAGEA